MSFIKSDGANIKIKFDLPLVGEREGNETHFQITGKEYKYVGDVNGPLIDQSYTVVRVYMPKIYEIVPPSTFNLTEEKAGVVRLVNNI